MTQKPLYTHPMRVAELNGKKPTRFKLRLEEAARYALQGDLGLLGLRKVAFAGEISTDGKRGWKLKGRFGATVVQSCVLTNEPVSTRIDEDVIRRYQPDLELPQDEESEMPEDESLEQLGTDIDLGLVLAEALALSLPDYPRAEDASFEDITSIPAGAEVIKDEELKPFAGLKALRDQLGDDET